MSATLTVGNVCLSGSKTFSERLGSGLDTGAEAQEIKAALAKAVPGLPLGTVLDGVSRAVEELLSVPVSQILVGAWERSRELRSAIAKTRESADMNVLLPLLRHTITSEHRAHVDVVKDAIPIARLVFPVKLEFRLEGVVLRIHTGRITEILAGDIKVKATLQFGDFVIFEKAFAPISIPGSLLVGRPEAA